MALKILHAFPQIVSEISQSWDIEVIRWGIPISHETTSATLNNSIFVAFQVGRLGYQFDIKRLVKQALRRINTLFQDTVSNI